LLLFFGHFGTLGAGLKMDVGVVAPVKFAAPAASNVAEDTMKMN
jgi:hypothetical protein